MLSVEDGGRRCDPRRPIFRDHYQAVAIIAAQGGRERVAALLATSTTPQAG
jgi:hypothetical protein